MYKTSLVEFLRRRLENRNLVGCRFLLLLSVISFYSFDDGDNEGANILLIYSLVFAHFNVEILKFFLNKLR